MKWTPGTENEDVIDQRGKKPSGGSGAMLRQRFGAPGAGVWGNSAKGKHLLEEDDLEEALTAATAIGDDRLEKDAGMDVNPETFTHGTSAQRVKWFRRGFESGQFEACDTFSVEAP